MGESLKPRIIISGVNLTYGGPLSIFKDAVKTCISEYGRNFSITLLVNSKSLFSEYNNLQTTCLEYKWVKRSWLLRLWFEYISSYFISKKLNPILWLSLHDITPNVTAKVRAVYCHNPAPFYKVSAKEAKLEPVFFLFCLLYKILYRINIHKNDYVVVQQQWLREEFQHNYKVKNVIVAHPSICSYHNRHSISNPSLKKYAFFYPAFPRVFKNFETLMEAVKILLLSRDDFEVIVTIKGNENPYAKEISRKFGYLENIKFMGAQSREEVLQLYKETNCLVFPSKLETWGLPISEMKNFCKPMLLANEKYAKETAGTYEKIKFFDTENPLELSQCMSNAIDENLQYTKNEYRNPSLPFTKNWKELFNVLLG